MLILTLMINKPEDYNKIGFQKKVVITTLINNV